MVYDFGKYVGHFLENLSENRIKLISSLVLHQPNGVHWKDFELDTGMRGGELDNALKKLVANGFVQKDDLSTYYLTEWGEQAFYLSLVLGALLTKLDSPPHEYMSNEEFEKLRNIIKAMVKYTRSSRQQKAFVEVNEYLESRKHPRIVPSMDILMV